MMEKKSSATTRFLQSPGSRFLLAANFAIALVYFFVLAFWFPRGNPVLFWLLIAGEVFHVWQLATYIHAVWDTSSARPCDPSYRPPIDVFITVAGEPEDIVERTAWAAKQMRYPNFRVFILNDGYVAKKENWRDIENMAERLGVCCITRTIPGGAKSGNINHALMRTGSPFIAILDADHVPHRDFLAKTAGYFDDPRVAFVQSPQFYRNHALNQVTSGAWEQQKIFFGAICRGKNRLNAAFMCGTNMVIRRSALLEVGGMNMENITEDFMTSQFIHQRGWRSVYVPEVLAEGLAPEDFLSYAKQQYRWARGSLETIFLHNPLFRRGFTWNQRIQYLGSASFYLTGPVVAMNAFFPLLFFYTGLVPFKAPTMALAAVFLPYIFLTVYNLRRASNSSYTYRAVAFSLSSFVIHCKALWSLLAGEKVQFAVTSKKAVEGNYLPLVAPHLAYSALALIGCCVAVWRDGLSPSVMNNMAWAAFYVGMFAPFIAAALPARALAILQKPAPISVKKSA